MSPSVGCFVSEGTSRMPDAPHITIHRTDPDRLHKEERRQQDGFDIVGSLPLELVIHVVQYLDPMDIAQGQRVSKRWRTLLSNNTVVTPVLRETVRFLGLDLKDTDLANADAMSYFRWQHGLRCGRPVKKIFLPWPAESSRLPAEIKCHSRRLYYRYWDREDIEMLNLETGERSIWSPDTRDSKVINSLTQFTLSGRYLVLVTVRVGLGTDTDNMMTAWDIYTSRRLIQRFPEFPYLSSLVNDKVVVACQSRDESSTVYIWDLSSNQIRRIKTGFFSGLHSINLLHVATDDDVLVAFHVNWKKRLPEVLQVKWTLTTGVLLEKKQFRLSLAGRDGRSYKRGISPTLGFCCNYSHKTITKHYHLSTDYERADLHVMYDYAVDELSARWIEWDSFHNRPSGLDSFVIPTPTIIYNWAMSGQPAIYDVANGTTTLLPHQLDSRVIANRRLSGSELERGGEAVKPFGDQEVFGLAGDGGVELWFFNPNFVPDLRDGDEGVWVDSQTSTHTTT